MQSHLKVKINNSVKTQLKSNRLKLPAMIYTMVLILTSLNTRCDTFFEHNLRNQEYMINNCLKRDVPVNNMTRHKEKGQ